MGFKHALIFTTCLLAGCTTAPLEEDEERPLTGHRDGAVTNDGSIDYIGDVPISDEVVPGDPSWAVESWTRLPVNMPVPTLETLAGKVVVILCFQHW